MAEIETERMPASKKAIDGGVKTEGPKISITGVKPGIKSFEDYDVFSGRPGPTREEYKESTFHNSTQDAGDDTFNRKAEMLQVTGRELFQEEKKLQTDVEDKMESNIEPEGQKE